MDDSKQLKHILAGTAQIDITPPVGVPLSGYILREGFSTGVHDSLFVKALVLKHEQIQVAILTCDLLGLDRAYVARVRKQIQTAVGIPGEHVLLTCSHTHSGPPSIFLQDCGEVEADWRDFLLDRLVTATQLAIMREQPATLSAAAGPVTAGVHNRRNPGDAVDPELGIVQLAGEEGVPLAILLNFACHPTCLGADNLFLSADYPGIITHSLQHSSGAAALFLNGAIGDVGPLERGYASAERLGSTVAREARQLLRELRQTETETIQVAAKTLQLPLQKLPTAHQLEQEIMRCHKLVHDAQVALQPSQEKIYRALLHWAQRTLHDLNKEALGDTVTAEIQVIRLGDLALVGVPGELFAELGLQIKEASDSLQVMVCGFANGNIGYIPARRAYAQGGYEIDEAYKYYGYPSVLAADAGEMIVEAASQLLSELTK